MIAKHKSALSLTNDCHLIRSNIWWSQGGLKLAKEIAKLHFSQQNYSGARQALETAFLRYPDHVSHEDINLLLDVLFIIKSYADGLLVLQTYAGVKLVPKVRPGHTCNYLSKTYNYFYKKCLHCLLVLMVLYWSRNRAKIITIYISKIKLVIS